jgi:hypothetical protein
MYAKVINLNYFGEKTMMIVAFVPTAFLKKIKNRYS